MRGIIIEDEALTPIGKHKASKKLPWYLIPVEAEKGKVTVRIHTLYLIWLRYIVMYRIFKDFLKTLTPLACINYVLQFAYIRLAMSYEVNEATEKRRFAGLYIMYWIKPLTGWDTPFVYAGKSRTSVCIFRPIRFK